MTAADELVEAVADAIRQVEYECELAEAFQVCIGDSYPLLAHAVLAVPAIADALAGCHAITGEDGTSYCPLAERDAALLAKVRAIVDEWRDDDGFLDGYTPDEAAPMTLRVIAALYPEAGK